MRHADCHPELRHYGNGLCRNCWRRMDNARQPTEQKAKKKAYMKAYHERNRPTRAELRDRTLQSRYGITSEDFDRMVKDQGGVCLLCPREARVVDHCHETKRTRGILCYGCNTALNRVEVPGWTEAAHKHIKG